MSFRAGIQHRFEFEEKFDLLAGLDAGYMSYSQNAAAIAAAGLDLSIFNIISVMAGYHFSSNGRIEPSYISTGVGVHFAGFSLDIAYLISGSPIGNTLGLSLRYSL